MWYDFVIEPTHGSLRIAPIEIGSEILRCGACFRPDTLVEAPLVAALAQLVEHIIRNDGARGSSPLSGTTPSTRQMREIRLKGLSGGNRLGSCWGRLRLRKWSDPR